MNRKMIIFPGLLKNIDYNNLIVNENSFDVNELWKIIDFIHENYTYNSELPGKFEREFYDIYTSQVINGCCDAAILFENIARGRGIATIHVLTAMNKWIDGDVTGHFGHHFCECYISGKWVLVDPMNKEIYEEYNNTKMHINAKDAGYTVYAKCHDLSELESVLPEGKNGVQRHNGLMDLVKEELKNLK